MLQFRILEYEGNFRAWSTFTSSFAGKKTEPQSTYLPIIQFSLVFTRLNFCSYFSSNTCHGKKQNFEKYGKVERKKVRNHLAYHSRDN